MQQAVIDKGRIGLASVWIIPLLALLLGIWLLADNLLNRGPVVQLTLTSADGLVAGETRVRRLSVELGTVTEIYLNEGFDQVIAEVELEKGAEELLRDDTQFWVVRPRINTDGISGLSTLLSGAYIEVAPGEGETGVRHYSVLDEPPVTPPTTPGLRLELVSNLMTSSLGIGSPVYFNGFRVGKVEAHRLNPDQGITHYDIFIEEEYENLVTRNTRFWNASGLSFNASANGVSVHAESLETLLIGGVAFGYPDGAAAGEPARDGDDYRLYESYSSSQEQLFFYKKEYLLLFDSSIRGLSRGAPVEYRGVRLGSVEDFSIGLADPEAGIVPATEGLMRVYISVEPGRILEDTPDAIAQVEELFELAVMNGMRASLTSGNLLTGALYVSLDFDENTEPQAITQTDGFDVLPTTSSGLVQIEQQITSLLERIENLPLEGTFSNAEVAMGSVSDAADQTRLMMESLEQLVADPALQGLPQQLERLTSELSGIAEGFADDSPLYSELQSALDELRETLRNARELTTELNEQPSRILFPSTRQPDLIPGDNR